MTIDREGIITIRYEPSNRKDGVKHVTVNGNGLTGRQFQDILAILVAQSEFNYNFIKLMEVRKRNLDVTDEELVQMFVGGVKVSQANNSNAEQLRIEKKSKVVSGLSSRVEEKNNNRYEGQEEKTSQKEIGIDDFVNLSGSNMTPPIPPPPIDSKSQASHMSSVKLEPLGKENGQEVKQWGRPDQYSSGLPRPQEHSSSGQDYGVQQDRVTDEVIKKEIEDAEKTQIRAMEENNSKKKERTNFGQSF